MIELQRAEYSLLIGLPILREFVVFEFRCCLCITQHADVKHLTVNDLIVYFNFVLHGVYIQKVDFISETGTGWYKPYSIPGRRRGALRCNRTRAVS